MRNAISLIDLYSKNLVSEIYEVNKENLEKYQNTFSENFTGEFGFIAYDIKSKESNAIMLSNLSSDQIHKIYQLKEIIDENYDDNEVEKKIFFLVKNDNDFSLLFVDGKKITDKDLKLNSCKELFDKITELNFFKTDFIEPSRLKDIDSVVMNQENGSLPNISSSCSSLSYSSSDSDYSLGSELEMSKFKIEFESGVKIIIPVLSEKDGIFKSNEYIFSPEQLINFYLTTSKEMKEEPNNYICFDKDQKLCIISIKSELPRTDFEFNKIPTVSEIGKFLKEEFNSKLVSKTMIKGASADNLERPDCKNLVVC